MRELKLMTRPDFEGPYVDSEVVFAPAEEAVKEITPATDSVVELQGSATVTTSASATLSVVSEPSHRISRLESASRPPVFVKPDATVAEAVTLMTLHRFSQLPVMQDVDSRGAKGVISWHSLGGRWAHGRSSQYVRECMEEPHVIGLDESLFDAIRIIAEHDFVLVESSDKRICGIVTAYDMIAQFKQLAEPFLLLGDIENRIRNLIDSEFTGLELDKFRDPGDPDKKIEDASDLTFGEYKRLLENIDNWSRLKSGFERTVFIETLEKVRIIRNDVMHFDPDPIDQDDLKLLQTFAHLLERWQQIRS